MCTHRRVAPAPSGATATASSWSLAPSGSMVMTRWSRRSRRPGSAATAESSASSASRRTARGKGRAEALGRQQPGQGRAGRRRRPEDLGHAPGAAAGRHHDEVAHLGPAAGALGERDPRPGLEGRLGGGAAAGGDQLADQDRRRAAAAHRRRRRQRQGPLQRLVARGGRRVVHDPHVGRQAALGEVEAVRGEVAGGRQLEGAAVAQRPGALHERLAEGALADQLGPVGVAQRARHDLAGARAAAVNEHDQRQVAGRRVAVGAEGPLAASGGPR